MVRPMTSPLAALCPGLDRTLRPLPILDRPTPVQHLERLGRANPMFGPVAAELSRHVGPISGSLQVVGDSLVATSSLSIR